MPLTSIMHESSAFENSLKHIISEVESSGDINVPLVMRFEKNKQLYFGNPKDMFPEDVMASMFTSNQIVNSKNIDLVRAISNPINAHNYHSNWNFKNSKLKSITTIMYNYGDDAEHKLVFFLMPLINFKPNVKLVGISIRKVKTSEL